MHKPFKYPFISLDSSPDLEEDEVLLLGVRQGFSGGLPPVAPREADHLPQQTEVGLVGDQGEHDEIGIQAVETVALVWREARLAFLPPDVLHDLVLPLPRHVMPCPK